MADLFDGLQSITWGDDLTGIAFDGRKITIDASIITGRWVAVIPCFGKDVVTRRARRSIDEAKAAAELAVRETST